ncbi:hypothetical protein [Endozoicomonas numazuensis]|nr:hypothetical protein [Endozoicomonas numazuensis]
MNIIFRQVLVGLSVAFLVPLTSVYGHVFYCPPGEKITLDQQASKRLWAAPVQQAPDNAPYFFKALRYTAESLVEEMGSRDHHDDVTHPDPNSELQFLKAYYNGDEPFRYGCIYADKNNAQFKIKLTFSDVKIPGSNLPLLVRTFGGEWNKSKDGTCRIRGRCGFFVPEVSIRYELISGVELGDKDAGITLMGLFDRDNRPKNMTFPATPGRHYRMESEAVFQRSGVTRLLLNYLGREMEMFSFLRAAGFQTKTRPYCSFKFDKVEVCDCTEQNIQEGRRTHTHLTLDIYQGVDDHKATSKLSCDLYSLPFSGCDYTPHNHEDHEEL